MERPPAWERSVGVANVLRRAGLLLGLAALAAGSPRAPAVAASYSASGTHQCKASDGSIYSCVVTGFVFGDCISATASLRAMDCCPSSRVCGRVSQGRETNCRRGGTSIGFTMNYCIPGPR
jgi:hypothetical protein